MKYIIEIERHNEAFAVPLILRLNNAVFYYDSLSEFTFQCECLLVFELLKIKRNRYCF
jgi:hypothetical protein